MSLEKVDYPIKKYLVLIKKELYKNIKIGKNKFYFNFGNEKHFPITFNLLIDIVKNDYINYSGHVNLKEVLAKKYKNFNVNIEIELKENKINYDELLSIINHELKHVYDYYHDYNRDTMDNMLGYDKLEDKYKSNNNLSYFLHLIYSATIHEMDAKCSMIYERLRYLKSFDKSSVLNIFKKSYIYKELVLLNDFSYKKLLSSVTKDELFIFTKDLVENFYKDDFDKYYKTDDDIIRFYRNSEFFFKKTFKDYLEIAYNIIDELILDNTPYNEVRLFTDRNHFRINPNEIQSHIDGIYEYLGFKPVEHTHIKTFEEFLYEKYLNITSDDYDNCEECYQDGMIDIIDCDDMKKYILEEAGNLDWKIVGVYDSIEEALEVFKSYTGIKDISINDEMYNILYNNDYKITEIC